ncbi:MAG: AAA family ATPase [Planctomycetota bacterium]
MYLQHWGFERSPFVATPETPYPTRPLAEATARADYLVGERRRMGVLLGGRGVGKTTCLATIADEQRSGSRRAAVASIDAVALTARELLWRTAEGLGAAPDPADTQMNLWRRIEDRLAEQRWQQRPTVLLIDDAQELGADSQQQLVRLARLDGTPEAQWTILLASPADTLERLNDALLHLIDLRIDLGPWAIDDTIGYVQTCLVDAGRLDPVFDYTALERLHELSRGVPRHVVRLADFALLAGAGCRAETIDTEIVEQAFAETKWAPAGVALAS